MRTVVTGGAGFIGSNLVDALLARGDSVTVVDNFASGKRENLNPAATLLEHDIREPFSVEADVIFHLAAQADVQTSMQRPELRRGGQRRRHRQRARRRARRPGDLRLVRRRRLRRVRRACHRADAVPAALRRTASRRSAARSTWPGGTASTARTTSPLRFANVYGPRQDSGLEGGVVAIFLERLAARRGHGDLRRRSAGTRLRLRRRHRRLAARRRRRARAGRTTSGPAATRPSPTCTRRARGSPAAAEPPRHEPARLGDVQRSVLDAQLIERELGWRAARLTRRRPRPDLGLDEGAHTPLAEGDARAEGESGPAHGCAAASRRPDPPLADRDPRREPRRGARADRAGRAGARPAREAARPRGAAPRGGGGARSGRQAPAPRSSTSRRSRSASRS